MVNAEIEEAAFCEDRGVADRVTKVPRQRAVARENVGAGRVRPFESLRAALSYVDGRLSPAQERLQSPITNHFLSSRFLDLLRFNADVG